MTSQFRLGSITVDLMLKDIKHVHLSVHPPTGRVRISAPQRMRLETIRAFAIAKLGWIKAQQARLRAQARETPREYVGRESHYVWGDRYLMVVKEVEAAPRVELKPKRLVLQVRPATNKRQRHEILEDWYRNLIRAELPPLIDKWSHRMGVQVERVVVRHMRTRWGSCTPRTRSIRLNTELAKKPRECLEYVLVHEMVHFLERSHNARFVELITRFMPGWRAHRDELNRLPIRHEKWLL